MNQKQKLGYMVLGAGILALGITIGQFITPDIEAQSNGVFDKITCRELVVVDSSGKEAIFLKSTKKNNNIIIMGKEGGLIGLSTDETEGNGVVIFGNDQSPPALRLYSHDESGNGIVIQSKHGKKGIYLTTDEEGNQVTINDHYGNPTVHLVSGKNVDGVVVWDKAGNVKWSTP